MTQTQQISAHLKQRRSITPLEALADYGCFRLAAVIHKLRKEGMPIISERKTDLRTFKHYAMYYLVKPTKPTQKQLFPC